MLNKSLGKTVPENHILVEEEVVAHKITEIIFFSFMYSARLENTLLNITKRNSITSGFPERITSMLLAIAK